MLLYDLENLIIFDMILYNITIYQFIDRTIP